MSIAPKPIEGGCLCGAVRYKVTFVADESSQTPSGFSAHACHCTMCRKHSGALFLPFLVIPPPSTIAWLHHSEPLPAHPHAHKDDTKPVISGTFTEAYPPSLKEYNSSGICTRGFCGTCGSSLFWQSGGRGVESTGDANNGMLDEASNSRSHGRPFQGNREI